VCVRATIHISAPAHSSCTMVWVVDGPSFSQLWTLQCTRCRPRCPDKSLIPSYPAFLESLRTSTLTLSHGCYCFLACCHGSGCRHSHAKRRWPGAAVWRTYRANAPNFIFWPAADVWSAEHDCWGVVHCAGEKMTRCWCTTPNEALGTFSDLSRAHAASTCNLMWRAELPPMPTCIWALIHMWPHLSLASWRMSLVYVPQCFR